MLCGPQAEDSKKETAAFTVGFFEWHIVIFCAIIRVVGKSILERNSLCMILKSKRNVSYCVRSQLLTQRRCLNG